MSKRPRAGARTPPAPPPKPTPKARKLQRELQEATLEAQVIRARRTARRLKESAALDYDWVSPWQSLLAQRAAGEPGWAPVGLGRSGQHGAQFPFYQTEQQLGMLRDLSRIVVGTNPNAEGLLFGWNSFVMGTGFATKVSAKKGSGENGAAAALRVTAFLDHWAKKNNWGERQQELGWRTERDGDGILRLFPDDGWLKCRFVWPEQVTQPPDASFEEYGFGVKWACNEDGEPDEEAVEEYYVASGRAAGGGDRVSAADMILFQPRGDSGVKRRLPLFSFGARELLDCAGRLTRNLGEGAAVRAAIAYMRKQAAAGEDDVNAANFADADYRERTGFGSDTYRPVNVSYPGMVVDFPEGVEHVPQPVASDTAANSTVVDLLLRGASAKLNAPEWLASSNAANMGAYTSSLVAESPFVKRVQQTQGYYRARFLRVIDRALAVAAAHGIVDRRDLEMVDVDLVPPSPVVRDRNQEAQSAAVEIPLGVDSRQRYCESLDRDYETIEAENKDYADKFGTPGQPLPDDAPPDDDGSGGGGGAGAGTSGLTEGLLEAVGAEWYTEAEYRNLVEADRSHLVRKKITRADGNQTWVWVNPDKGKHAGSVKPKSADHNPTLDAETAVSHALNAPHELSADHVERLAQHLDTLPRDRLKEIARQVDAKVGGLKRELVQRLMEHVGAQANPDQAPGGALARGEEPTKRTPTNVGNAVDKPTSVGNNTPVPPTSGGVQTGGVKVNGLTNLHAVTLVNPDAGAKVAHVTLQVMAAKPGFTAQNPHNRQHGEFHAVYSMTRRDGTTSTVAGSPFKTEAAAREQAEKWAADLAAKNPALVREGA